MIEFPTDKLQRGVNAVEPLETPVAMILWTHHDLLAIDINQTVVGDTCSNELVTFQSTTSAGAPQ